MKWTLCPQAQIGKALGAMSIAPPNISYIVRKFDFMHAPFVQLINGNQYTNKILMSTNYYFSPITKRI